MPPPTSMSGLGTVASAGARHLPKTSRPPHKGAVTLHDQSGRGSEGKPGSGLPGRQGLAPPLSPDSGLPKPPAQKPHPRSRARPPSPSPAGHWSSSLWCLVQGSVCLAWVSGWTLEAPPTAAGTPHEPGGQGGGRRVEIRFLKLSETSLHSIEVGMCWAGEHGNEAGWGQEGKAGGSVRHRCRGWRLPGTSGGGYVGEL